LITSRPAHAHRSAPPRPPGATTSEGLLPAIIRPGSARVAVTCLWPSVFGTRHVTGELIRDRSPVGYDQALVTTDTVATARAVERTGPSQLADQAVTACWYATADHDPADVADRRARAHWYTTKAGRRPPTWPPSSAV
jgi:hypothetical protein